MPRIAIGDKLGGKGTVALTQGSIERHRERHVGLVPRRRSAEKYPDIKVLDTQMEGFEPSAAEAKAVGILQANPDVTGAFSTTGNGVQTWSGAARKAGRDVVIIGMDYIRQNLDIIKSGAAYGLVAQPLYEEGAKTAELAAALAEGKTVDVHQPAAGQGDHRRRPRPLLQDPRQRRPVAAPRRGASGASGSLSG